MCYLSSDHGMASGQTVPILPTASWLETFSSIQRMHTLTVFQGPAGNVDISRDEVPNERRQEGLECSIAEMHSVATSLLTTIAYSERHLGCK